MNATSPTPPTIEILVHTDGSTTVETHGFVGTACRTATAFLERALGQVASEQPKPQLYEQAAVTEHEHETS